MPRTLPAAVTTAIGETATSPTYLVRLGFATEIRGSTLGDITWDAESWTDNGVRVERITENGGRISLPNTDNVASGLVLTEGQSDVAISVYKYYESDAVEIMRGFLSSADIQKDRVVFDAVGSSSDISKVPTKRFTPTNGFNYLPNPTAEIRWAGIIITFDAAPDEF